MASRLYFVIFILALISLLHVETVNGREISTIKKDNNATNKNATAQNGLIRPGLLLNDHQLGTDNVIQHFAVMRWPQSSDLSIDQYGTKATLNVYSLPEVGDDQSSSIAIWVMNGFGDPEKSNDIVAGWHVHPKLYGDHNTHFFVYWNANKRGCFNLKCEGFVPYKSAKYVPGIRLDPISKIDGKQYELTLQITKDSQTGDWRLFAGADANEPLGHWPKSLFTSLAESATMFAWGGVVSFYPSQKSPPMGSGRYPREGFGKAAFIRDIQLFFEDGSYSDFKTRRYEDQTYCYQVDGDGPYYYFGGPGGCTS